MYPAQYNFIIENDYQSIQITMVSIVITHLSFCFQTSYFGRGYENPALLKTVGSTFLILSLEYSYLPKRCVYNFEPFRKKNVRTLMDLCSVAFRTGYFSKSCFVLFTAHVIIYTVFIFSLSVFEVRRNDFN